MKTKEYYKEYRSLKGKELAAQLAEINEKLDFLVSIASGMTPLKPKEKKPMSGQIAKDVLKAVDAMVPIDRSKPFCMRCGAVAFYKDDIGLYCPSHSTKDSNPI